MLSIPEAVKGNWSCFSGIVSQFLSVIDVGQGKLPQQSVEKPQRRMRLPLFSAKALTGEGARQIVALLRSRGIKLDFILDEGLLITQGVMMGLKPPVALIGVAEKGYLTLALTSSAVGGGIPPCHRVARQSEV